VSAIAALVAATSVLAGLVVLAALPEHFKRWPFTEDLNVENLPRCLSVAAAVLALLIAPALTRRTSASAGSVLVRAGFLSLWQSAVLGFFLLLASRLAPVAFEAGLKSACVLFGVAYAAFVVAERAPRLYPGAALLWGCVGPLCVYLFGEIAFFNAAGPAQQAAMKSLRQWALGSSPATAAHGCVAGKLLGGDVYTWGAAFLLVGGCLAAALLTLACTRQRTPAVGKSLH
jgi:hypothetical protein